MLGLPDVKDALGCSGHLAQRVVLVAGRPTILLAGASSRWCLPEIRAQEVAQYRLGGYGQAVHGSDILFSRLKGVEPRQGEQLEDSHDVRVGVLGEELLERVSPWVRPGTILKASTHNSPTESRLRCLSDRARKPDRGKVQEHAEPMYNSIGRPGFVGNATFA